MEMTHYMELLAVNQPWNLIVFMAVPVVLAETIAITELYLLVMNTLQGTIRSIQRFSGIAVGLYMIPVLYYIITQAIIPISLSGSWRGVGDVIAVWGYALAALPLIGIGLLEIGLLERWVPQGKWKHVYALFVAAFLVLAHIAMIFGMLNPSVFGASSTHMPM